MTTDVDANHDIGYVRGVRYRFISTNEGSLSRIMVVIKTPAVPMKHVIDII